jgi:hypothetical protein
MPTKLTNETMLERKSTLSESVVATKSRMSSAIRWSGLSVPMGPEAPARLIR